MGHFHTEVTAVGQNQEIAQANAIADFFREHGPQHNLREIESATFVKKVPPNKTVETKRRSKIWPFHEAVYISSEPDPAAPEDEWLEQWTFTLHTHA